MRGIRKKLENMDDRMLEIKNTLRSIENRQRNASISLDAAFSMLEKILRLFRKK